MRHNRPHFTAKRNAAAELATEYASDMEIWAVKRLVGVQVPVIRPSFRCHEVGLPASICPQSLAV
jgi:hypothetical protein